MTKKYTLSMLLFLAYTFSSFAADIENVNSSGTFQWNSGSTWVGGVVPGAGDNVILRGVSGGVVIQVPAGTFQINDLSLPSSINLSIELLQNADLEMTGQLIKRGTTFGDNMITSLNGGAVTGGRIIFKGSGRNIAPGSNTDQLTNYGVRDQIKNWICEIDLDSDAEVATVFATEDFMCGRFTLRTGQLEMGAGTSLLVNRNSSGSSSNGTNGSGSLFLSGGTTLTTSYAGRRTTSTTYIGPLTVSTGATLILMEGGNGSLNGEDITINGKLVMNGSTTILSSCSTCNNGGDGTGEGTSDLTIGPVAEYEYNVPSGFTKAMGSELSRAGGGTTSPPTVYTMTVNTNNMTDRLLTTQSVGNADFANSVWIENALNLNGIIEIGDEGSETVYLRNGATLTGASTSNYVLITRRSDQTFQRGFRRFVNGGESLLFPVALEANGTIERYTPFIITNNGSNQSFSFSAMEPDSWGIDGTDGTLFPEMMNNFTNATFNSPSATAVTAADMIQDVRWDFDPNTGSADVSMKVGFGANVTIGANIASNAEKFFFHNPESSAATWDELDALWSPADAAVFGLPSLTLDMSFSSSDVGALGFGSHNTLLPVELTSFTAVEREKKNILSWETASELNSSHYDIQRSSDGINFQNIGSVNSKNKGAITQQYNFVDERPLTTSYYRLMMVDFDESFEYSKVVVIKRAGDTGLTLYPNPITESVNVSFEEGIDDLIQIIDARGIVVYNNVHTAGEKEAFSIDLTHLTSGMYVLRTATTSKVFMKR